MPLTLPTVGPTLPRCSTNSDLATSTSTRPRRRPVEQGFAIESHAAKKRADARTQGSCQQRPNTARSLCTSQGLRCPSQVAQRLIVEIRSRQRARTAAIQALLQPSRSSRKVLRHQNLSLLHGVSVAQPPTCRALRYEEFKPLRLRSRLQGSSLPTPGD